MTGQGRCQRQEVTMDFPFQNMHNKAKPKLDICSSSQLKMNKRKLGVSSLIQKCLHLLQDWGNCCSFYEPRTQTPRFWSKIWNWGFSITYHSSIYPGKWKEEKQGYRLRHSCWHEAEEQDSSQGSANFFFFKVTKDVLFLPIASQMLSAGTVCFSILITLKQNPSSRSFLSPSRGTAHLLG